MRLCMPQVIVIVGPKFRWDLEKKEEVYHRIILAKTWLCRQQNKMR